MPQSTTDPRPLSATITLDVQDARLPKILTALYGGLEEEQRVRAATGLLLDEVRLHDTDTVTLSVDIDHEGVVRIATTIDGTTEDQPAGHLFQQLSSLADLDLVRTSRRRSTAATVPGPVTEQWLQQASNKTTD